MMKPYAIRLIFILSFTFFIGGFIDGCQEKRGVNTGQEGFAIANVIEKIKETYSPDSRVAIYDIWVDHSKNGWVLAGETNIPEAKRALISALNEQGIFPKDSILVLPVSLDSAFALIRVSVANLRAKPSYAAELVTQATLGLPLRVYKKMRGWYKVQTPDSYIAWVNGAALVRLTKWEFDSLTRIPKIIFLETYGFSYEKPSKSSGHISDLVAGNILSYMGRKKGFIQVSYPDGVIGWIPESSGRNYNDWLKDLEQGGEDIIRTAMTLKGIPYMWGGTSTKMMDCSGFTKTVFFLNGMVIPRDASQQSMAGVLVDSTRHFEHLRPGDLLFFGVKAREDQPERVIHVGLWLGGGRFIHASGSVHISSLVPGTKEYDEYNDRRYLKARRLLNTNSPGIINLKRKNIFLSEE